MKGNQCRGQKKSAWKNNLALLESLYNPLMTLYIDKKENQIFFIYKEIQKRNTQLSGKKVRTLYVVFVFH